MFYLDGGSEPHQLALGETFEVVYAPQSPPMTEAQQGWYVVVFEVVMSREIRKPYDWVRTYQDNGWRRISELDAVRLWRQSQ